MSEQTNKTTAMNRGGEIRWGGMKTTTYFVVLGIVLAATYTKGLPGGWLGGYTLATTLGILFEKIGDNTPIVKDYFGGGAIVTLFASAALTYFNVLPKPAMDLMKEFMGRMDFFGVLAAALVSGSIISMDRKLLIKAGLLYAVPVFGGLIFAFGLAALVGSIIGFGGIKSVMMVALPIMGGGTAAGAIPLAQIYGSALQNDPKLYLSMVMPAVALGNALAIVSGGFLDKIGTAKPTWTGNGELMVGFQAEKSKASSPDYTKMGVGFLLTGIFFAVSIMLSKFIPMHYYAITIVLVAVLKIANVFSDEHCEAVKQWFEFLVKTCIPAILFTIGLVVVDLKMVIAAMTWQYWALCIVTVVGAIIGAGLFGRLVGFYPIESSITAGLCMANMGGSGDIATLAAAKRMALLPFATISSRLGGALILVLASLMVRMLGVG